MPLSIAAVLCLTLVPGPPPPDPIRARVFAFYRDDRAHRWPDVLDHFTMGKIAARWPAPSDDPAWARAARPDASAPCDSSRDDLPSRTATTVVGRWARVFVTWCGSGSTDEVWLLRIGSDWKIARLVRAVPRLGAYGAPLVPR